MTRFAWPVAVWAFGIVVLGGLAIAWATPGNEWVVFTIMPMMGTPYIVAGAAVWSATGEIVRLLAEQEQEQQ